jgi:hypothetical protein
VPQLSVPVIDARQGAARLARIKAQGAATSVRAACERTLNELAPACTANASASAPEGSGALAQIKARGYAEPYRAEGLPIHLIGIVFSRERRTLVDFAVETQAPGEW